MGIAKVVMAAFNAVMLANPIGLVVAAVVALIAAGALLIANWQTVKDWFAGFFDWMSAGFNKVKEIGSAVAGFFGMGGAANAQKTTGASTPALTPTPQAAAAITGGNQSVNQQTQIVVQGGANPDATARAVAGQQGRVNADMARNMKGAAR